MSELIRVEALDTLQGYALVVPNSPEHLRYTQTPAPEPEPEVETTPEPEPETTPEPDVEPETVKTAVVAAKTKTRR